MTNEIRGKFVPKAYVSRCVMWLSSNARTQFFYKGKTVPHMCKMYRRYDRQYCGVYFILSIRTAARVMYHGLCRDVYRLVYTTYRHMSLDEYKAADNRNHRGRFIGNHILHGDKADTSDINK